MDDSKANLAQPGNREKERKDGNKASKKPEWVSSMEIAAESGCANATRINDGGASSLVQDNASPAAPRLEDATLELVCTICRLIWDH